MKPKHLLLCAATLLSAACASDPVQFYTLVRPMAAAQPAAGAPAFELASVQVPSQVDVPQLVVRQSASEVALAEGRQWSAPLGEEIRAALAAELAAQGLRDVSGVSRGKEAKPWRVKLDVQRFESSPGHGVLIEALWSLRAPNNALAAASCASRVQEATGKDYAAVVEGHQRALGQIAAQIAATIKAAGAQAPNCP